MRQDEIEKLLEMMGDKELLKVAQSTLKENPKLTGDDLLAKAKGKAKNVARRKSGIFGWLTVDLLWQYPKVQAHLDRTLRDFLGLMTEGIEVAEVAE
ncbi:MAG: hypothetical protein V4671_08375 [Armatimonadota bacterium]